MGKTEQRAQNRATNENKAIDIRYKTIETKRKRT